MKTKKYRYTGKDFDIKAAPTKVKYSADDLKKIKEDQEKCKVNQECTKDDVCSASLWCFSSISSNGCGGKR